jgi:secondary thiamine-phosphate synthase enzyme
MDAKRFIKMWFQKTITLSPRSRGFHIFTPDVINQISEIEKIKTGILHLFIKHTSASLTINEDADPTVRTDFESHFNMLAPENQSYYQHTFEGPDDMPAHLKASLLGSSLSIPISDGKLNLGTWQGIYLCEHRDRSSARKVVATIQGE